MAYFKLVLNLNKKEGGFSYSFDKKPARRQPYFYKQLIIKVIVEL